MTHLPKTKEYDYLCLIIALDWIRLAKVLVRSTNKATDGEAVEAAASRNHRQKPARGLLQKER